LKTYQSCDDWDFARVEYVLLQKVLHKSMMLICNYSSMSIRQSLTKHSLVALLLDNKRSHQSVGALWREANIDVSLSNLPALELSISYWEESKQRDLGQPHLRTQSDHAISALPFFGA
jgi:hypothetical protein